MYGFVPIKLEAIRPLNALHESVAECMSHNWNSDGCHIRTRAFSAILGVVELHCTHLPFASLYQLRPLNVAGGDLRKEGALYLDMVNFGIARNGKPALTIAQNHLDKELYIVGLSISTPALFGMYVCMYVCMYTLVGR